MREQYTVNYHGQNLYSYQMTNEEKEIVETFRKELMEICNRLNVPRSKRFDGSPYMGRLKDNPDYQMKYKRDVGYFSLYGERGVFSMDERFPERNREEAKQIILEQEFRNGGFQFELESRAELEKEWVHTYTEEYDSRKAAFEYAIKLLWQVFNSFPDHVIAKYTDYMNLWLDSNYWYYDKKSMTFVKEN